MTITGFILLLGIGLYIFGVVKVEKEKKKEKKDIISRITKLEENSVKFQSFEIKPTNKRTYEECVLLCKELVLSENYESVIGLYIRLYRSGIFTNPNDKLIYENAKILLFTSLDDLFKKDNKQKYSIWDCIEYIKKEAQNEKEITLYNQNGKLYADYVITCILDMISKTKEENYTGKRE